MSIVKSMVSALLLVAAGTFATSANAQMGDGGTIRLMSNPSGTQSYPPFVMKNFELDKKYGFNLEVIPFTNAQAAIAAVQGKSVETVVQDWTTIARMRNQNIPIIGVAPFLAYVNTVLVPADSDIKTIGDLKGKRLGIFSKTSSDWILLQAAAKKSYNVDLSKEATLQEGAPALLRGTMEQGQLDATLMYNSLTPDMLLAGKAKLLITVHDIVAEMGITEVPYLMYAMREDYAVENPENAKAFVAAYREAIDILLSNEEVWREQGEIMKLAPEATEMFRQGASKEFVKEFKPEMADAINETFAILLDVAGPDVIGMTAMPDKVFTMDYQ